MTSSWIFRGVLLLVVGLTYGLVWANDIPLGVPGEWDWSRRKPEGDLIVPLVVSALVGLLYCGWAAWGRSRIGAAARFGRVAWVAGLVGVTLVWWWTVLSLLPGPTGIGRIPWVLYFPGSSGYFTQAKGEVHDSREFLRTYRQRVAEAEGMDRYLHLGTHPPGLALAFHGLISACERWPVLIRVSEATESTAVRESFEAIGSTAPRGAGPTRPERAALWLGWWLVAGGAALGGPAIYGLARRRLGPVESWSAAVLWPLVPAIVVFFPKSDALFGGLSPVLAWCWFRAVDRRSWLGAFVFGVLLYGCLLLSLAFLPVALLIAIASVLELVGKRLPVAGVPPNDSAAPLNLRPFSSTVQCVVAALIGFAVPLVGLWASAGYNTVGVALINLRNHAEFYQHSPRTYRSWLIVNPLELAMAAGLPVIAAMVYSVLRSRSIRRHVGSTVAAAGLVWVILWLSGKNMGEAARLWCFLLSWPVLATAALSQVDERHEDGRVRSDWTWLLVTQMFASLATVLVVDGFAFGKL